MTSNPVVVEQTFPSPIETVWQAITDAKQMPQWFFAPMSEFEPIVGFETVFTVEFEGQGYVHRWKVTEVVPNRKIVYDWLYDGVPGRTFVSWDLAETPEGTRLQLTHDGLETFPQDNPTFSRESTLAGWQYLIQKSLKEFLEAGKSS